MGRRLALSTGVTSAGGPIMERRTGMSTKPLSIPNTVRIANTAKKYLQERDRQLLVYVIPLLHFATGGDGELNKSENDHTFLVG